MPVTASTFGSYGGGGSSGGGSWGGSSEYPAGYPGGDTVSAVPSGGADYR